MTITFLGINKDTKIQRYIDFSKFIHLLESGSLFFSIMNNFEDKLEGGLTVIDDIFLSGCSNALHNLVNNTLVYTFGVDINTPEVIDEAKRRDQEYKESLKYRKIETVFGSLPLEDQNSHKKIINAQRNWLDVSCWHSGDEQIESMAMWKIYGGPSSSVAISSTVGKISDSIKINGGNRLIIAKVEYIDYLNEHYTLEHEIAPFIHKHKSYSFENEVRLIVFNPNVNPLSDRPSTEYGSIHDVDVNLLIDKVMVSPESPEWFYKLIHSIVKNRYKLDANVSRSNLDILYQKIKY